MALDTDDLTLDARVSVVLLLLLCKQRGKGIYMSVHAFECSASHHHRTRHSFMYLAVVCVCERFFCSE